MDNDLANLKKSLDNLALIIKPMSKDFFLGTVDKM